MLKTTLSALMIATLISCESTPTAPEVEDNSCELFMTFDTKYQNLCTNWVPADEIEVFGCSVDICNIISKNFTLPIDSGE